MSGGLSGWQWPMGSDVYEAEIFRDLAVLGVIAVSFE
jgi:hypothetical protein